MTDRTVLLVGTRKGLFVLESGDRRDWSVRGPYCESWPIYHAMLDPDSGTIFAAAASEWLGSAIWRSSDLGESWEHSSEGIGYPEGENGLKLSKVSHVMPAHGRLLVGAESAGLFESTIVASIPEHMLWSSSVSVQVGCAGQAACP